MSFAQSGVLSGQSSSLILPFSAENSYPNATLLLVQLVVAVFVNTSADIPRDALNADYMGNDFRGDGRVLSVSVSHQFNRYSTHSISLSYDPLVFAGAQFLFSGEVSPAAIEPGRRGTINIDYPDKNRARMTIDQVVQPNEDKNINAFYRLYVQCETEKQFQKNPLRIDKSQLALPSSIAAGVAAKTVKAIGSWQRASADDNGRNSFQFEFENEEGFRDCIVNIGASTTPADPPLITYRMTWITFVNQPVPSPTPEPSWTPEPSNGPAPSSAAASPSASHLPDQSASHFTFSIETIRKTSSGVFAAVLTICLLSTVGTIWAYLRRARPGHYLDYHHRMAQHSNHSNSNSNNRNAYRPVTGDL